MITEKARIKYEEIVREVALLEEEALATSSLRSELNPDRFQDRGRGENRWISKKPTLDQLDNPFERD